MSERRTISEAAAYLHLSVSTVRKLVREKSLVYYRIGRKLQFDQADLEQYLQRQKHGGPHETPVRSS